MQIMSPSNYDQEQRCIYNTIFILNQGPGSVRFFKDDLCIEMELQGLFQYKDAVFSV